MKLTSFRVFQEEIPLTQPFTISYHTTESTTLHFVEWQTDTGHHGWGSASPGQRVTGETDEACNAALQAMSALQGEDVRHLPRLLHYLETEFPKAPAARAALDMALHDLLARRLDIPLTDMLGRCHNSLPTSITLGLRSIEETLAEAKEKVGKGFSVIKVKLGQDLEFDLELLQRLRAELPQEILLRVDPNQGYDLQALQALLAKFDELRLEFVEQPMPVSETEQLRSLPLEQRQQLVLDESLQSPQDALRYGFQDPLCGGFNIKLMKCGGLGPARQIANLAQQTERTLMWGCNDESRLSLAAALHQALACPNTRYLDLDGDLDLVRDPAQGGYAIEKGAMIPLDQPGLGITVP